MGSALSALLEGPANEAVLPKIVFVNWWCKLRLFFVVGVMLALLACGNGSGSSSSVLGTGQDPDPVVVDFPIAYVDRPLLSDDGGNLLTIQVRRPVDFFPGAKLLLRDRASPSAPEVDLTAGIFPDELDGTPPLYDVKDLAVSYDGVSLVFAMRAPQDPDLDESQQPTWNIWLHDREAGTTTRVLRSDIVARSGQDVAPSFLPDGRIVFSSTRQRQAKAILLDEGKPQFSGLNEDRNEEALALHVMNVDGSDIKQITYNASSDLDPTVMSDGRVVYSRWDRVAGRDRISLYRVNPDGRGAELLYGVHSHDTGPDGDNIEFVQAAELPDGRLLVMLRPSGMQVRYGVVPVAIDVNNYMEHDQPTFASAGLLADAQEFLFPGDVHLDEDRPALQGRYAHVSPLFDGTSRLIVAWSQCRLLETTSDPVNPVIVPCTADNLANVAMIEADPLYGVWMHDRVENTQQPIVLPTEGRAISEVLVLEARAAPLVVLDGTTGVDLEADRVSEAVGVLHIRSVYDIDGTEIADIATLSDPGSTTADQRPARYLRIVKSVAIPNDDIVDLDRTAFGRSQAQLMREILGYANIEPDGSVKVKVPANVPFGVEVLDADGTRITPRHNNWIQLRPGEERECSGCHTRTSERPHGRIDAEAPSANFGAPVDGLSFPNTDPALFTNPGESMAEVLTRINGVPNLSMDITYTDIWTDTNVRAADPDIAFLYRDLSTEPPVASSCVANWQSNCRITLHYPVHIHPIWRVDRTVLDVDGITLLRDDTCTACHADRDTAGAERLPLAQLDLSDGASADEADHLKSYRELLFNDNEQEVVNGALQDVLVQATDANGNLLFQTDANGDLILDIDDEPIAVLVPVKVTPTLNVAGALMSPKFFTLFRPAGTHAGRLTEVELKVIREWIDIGGQYYNDPFVVPP